MNDESSVTVHSKSHLPGTNHGVGEALAQHRLNVRVHRDVDCMRNAEIIGSNPIVDIVIGVIPSAASCGPGCKLE